MKVWVVEFGEYSGRCVTGVYSTKENATIAARDNGDITEYELDAGIAPYQLGLQVFSVEMLKDGTVRRVTRFNFMSDDEQDFRFSIDVIPKGNVRWVWNQLNATVWARDETHAIKITNDERVRRIATGEWAKYQQEQDAEYDARQARIAASTSAKEDE